MGTVHKVPRLVTAPEQKPFQGKGKPDKILRNGRPGGTLEQQLLHAGRGGHQTKVITKAFSRQQKQDVAGSAALGAGVTAALNPGRIKRGVQYGAASMRMKSAAKKTTDIAGKGQYLKTGQEMGAVARGALKPVGRSALVWGGASGAITAGLAANKNRKARQLGPVVKMTDTELRRRKTAAGKIAVTTSTLGLGSLTALGAGAALKKPKLTKLAATGSIVSGGIGGAGGYNFAAIQRAEAKKRPVSKAYSPEASRHRRNRRQAQSANAVGVAGSAGAGLSAGLAANDELVRRGLKRKASAKIPDGYLYPNAPGERSTGNRGRFNGASVQGPPRQLFRDPNFGEKQAIGGNLKKVTALRNKRGKAALAFGALGVGGLVASDRISSYSTNKGQTYKARYKRPE